MRNSKELLEGEVIEIVGKRVKVDLPGGPRICPIRARAVIGDRVEVEDGVVVDNLPRKTELMRGSKAGIREVCANMDALLCVTSTMEPPFRPGMVDRVLAAAEATGITGGIILNKCDQGMPEAVLDRLALYEDLGYPVFMVSALQAKGFEKLQDFLKNRTTVMVGHSGVGKTSLFNVLTPGQNRPVGDLDEEGRGRHTTTNGILMPVPTGGRLIDLPGVREFGLEHVGKKELRRCFPEMAMLRCKFSDCLHREEEQGCLVPGLVEAGKIDELRLDSYRKILEEIT